MHQAAVFGTDLSALGPHILGGGARHALPLFAPRKTDKAAPFCPHRLHHHTGRVPAPSPGGSLTAVRGRGAHSAGKTGGIQERARRRAPQAGGRRTRSGAFASRARSSQGLSRVARSTGRHLPPSPACKGRDRPRHAAPRRAGARTNNNLLFFFSSYLGQAGAQQAGGRAGCHGWARWVGVSAGGCVECVRARAEVTARGEGEWTE